MSFRKVTVKSCTLHQRDTKNTIARKTLTIIPLQKKPSDLSSTILDDPSGTTLDSFTNKSETDRHRNTLLFLLIAMGSRSTFHHNCAQYAIYRHPYFLKSQIDSILYELKFPSQIFSPIKSYQKQTVSNDQGN